jgi:outer membrane protein TolC
VPDTDRSARLPLGLLCPIAFVCALMIAGCASWRGTDPVVENPIVEYYDRLASEVSEPDLSIHSPVPAPNLGEGRALTAPNPQDRWPLALAEAVRLGLQNSSIIRQNAQFMSPNNPVMQSPDSVPSVYDPPIQNSGVLFGSRGTDAALSDFDPRLTNSTKLTREELVQNVFSNLFPSDVLATEGVQYQTRLEQQLLSGGVVGFNNTWSQQQSNQFNQLFDGAYTGFLGLDIRQPLWAGSGREFTSIAGPLNQRARGFSYVNQGIVIAQINKKLSEIDLQENLQNLVREIGDLYWDLYQNYQDYDSERQTSKLAKALWDRAKDREGIDPGVEEAQAEDAYYESKSREELALSNLFLTEAKLRRLMGLSLDDSRLIYPTDDPRDEEISLNRSSCLYEALVNRVELTRQKMNIQSLELQLFAAKRLVAPRFDLVSGYGLNGFGKSFYNSNPNVISHTIVNGVEQTQPTQFNSAVTNLFSGKETTWNVGIEYSLSLWLRQEKAQVRQLEFRIVKARAALASQEDEIAHELNTVLMTVKRAHSMSKINRRRVDAARRRVLAAEADYEAGNKSNDLVLRSLTSLTQAKAAYSRSLSEYNKSLRDLLFRTGRLLPADGVSLLGVDGLPVIPPPAHDLPAPGASEDKDSLDSPDSPRDDYDRDLPPAPKPGGVASLRELPDDENEKPRRGSNIFGPADDESDSQPAVKRVTSLPYEELPEPDPAEEDVRPYTRRP